jgi:prepilin-type N-terminal cleavage/methylation domain-containing protein
VLTVLREYYEPRRPQRGGGFSLFELIAVMVVIGIMAGTAVVTLSTTTSNRSVVAAKQLLRDMTFARQRAVATGTRSWVSFNTAAHSWTVLVEDPDMPGRVNASILTDPATGAPFTQLLNTGQFAGVTLTAVNFDAQDEVGFDWLGRPLHEVTETTPLAGSGTVTFSGGQVLTVGSETGYVTMTP